LAGFFYALCYILYFGLFYGQFLAEYWPDAAARLNPVIIDSCQGLATADVFIMADLA
jgi:hypothetical protein